MERGALGVGYKERGSAVRIHPAWTATPTARAVSGPALRGCSTHPAASKPLAREVTVLASAVPTPIMRPWTPAGGGWGRRAALAVPPPPGRGAAEPRDHVKPRPVSSQSGEPRAQRSAGCGPRRVRGLGRSAAPGTGAPAQPPAGGERGMLPPLSTLHQSEGICGR